MRSSKIAILGTRGIPACYGGFETFVEEIGPRLVNSGFDVSVYGRKGVIKYHDQFYKGCRIILLPAIYHKYLETITHTFLSFLHIVIFNKVDLILLCNAANSPFAWIARIFGIPVIINVDGIERKRAKWNIFGRIWYYFGELSSVLFASKIVADAEVIYDYYRRTYRADSEIIAYGYRETDQSLIDQKLSGIDLKLDFLSNLKLKNNSYILYVSRLEPENNAHLVIDAYNQLVNDGIIFPEELPLVIVGDAPYSSDYILDLKRRAGDGVRFLGYVFGEGYLNLQLGAKIYIQATEVGGTHPALVESMGFANCVIAHKTAENIEVLGDCGYYFEYRSVQSLVEILGHLVLDSQKINESRRSAFLRAKQCYSWDKVTNDYIKLFENHLK